MICLKNRTFAVSQTTSNSLNYLFKGCDLLEKSYFCSIANNNLFSVVIQRWVVICLKNRTFAVSQTTRCVWREEDKVLWFAWKIVLLQYRKQLWRETSMSAHSCDLLEKSYFCSIANNYLSNAVILFPLWFAWKIVLLQYRKQHYGTKQQIMACCDLLEKSYFCSIANNQAIELNYP